MADRFPLILNTSTNQIQEIASGDNLDLTGSGISNAGIITAGNVTIGAATTDLIVTGDARITGILTIGTSSLKLDGPNNLVNVGTALTLGHTQGLQFHTQNLHSAGFEVNQINASGITTIGGKLDTNGVIEAIAGENKIPFLYADLASLPSASTYHGMFAHVHATGRGYYAHGGAWYELVNKDTNGNVALNKDLDVDGHTNLDNISVAGVSTFTGNASFSGGVSIGGTLTYEDVTNIDSVGIVTAREGVFIPDNKELKIGNTDTSPDLKIYHDTSDSIIHQDGTGDLRIRSDNSIEINTNGTQNAIWCDAGAAVKLYYNNGLKLKTTNTGVEVGDSVANTGVLSVNGGASSNPILASTSSDYVGKFSSTDAVARLIIQDNSGTNNGNGIQVQGDTLNLMTGDSPALTCDSSQNVTIAGDLSLSTANAMFKSLSSNSGDYVRLYAGAGTGKWDIYGNGANLRFTDNESAGKVVFDRQVDANGGLEVSGRTTTGGLTVNDNGVSGVIFDLRVDDQSPWMFHLGNDTYHGDGGLWAYQSNGGAFEIRARGNSEYIDLNFNRWNGSTNENLLQLSAAGSVKLKYQGSKKLETTTTGIEIHGGSADWSETNPGATKGSIHLDPDDNSNHFGSAITFGASDSGDGQSAQAGIYTRSDGSYGTKMYFATTSSYAAGSYARFMIDYNGNVLPTTNGLYDLGSSGLRWKNIYTTDLQLSNEGKTNDVDGTWGNYTIQEGESELFLINNRNGKKYKFNLTEVS